MGRRSKIVAAILVAVVAYVIAVTLGASHRARHAALAQSSPRQARRPALPSQLPPRRSASGEGPGVVMPRRDGSLPAGAWSLPGPTRYEGVAGVGYPKTVLGAVGLGYSALAARFTTDPDIAVSVVRATVMSPTTTFLEAVAQGTQALRTRFGLAPTGPTPTTIGLSLIGCRVATASGSRVVAGYEGTLSVEGGSVQGTTADVSVAIVLEWDGSDWKIDPTANLPTPPIDFPTSSDATTLEGWHVCTEA